MTDIFESVATKYRNTPSVIVLFLASVLMLIIGTNHFLEDTYSSYLGLKGIELVFNMNVQIFDWTYWTMSLAPQIASIVFFYMYLADTNKKWAFWVSIVCQAIDFLADVWYRSNGAVFQNVPVTIVSFLLTFGYFTLGSEIFLTVGAGLVIKLFAPAIFSWKSFKREISKAKGQFYNALNASSNYDKRPANFSSRKLHSETQESSNNDFDVVDGKRHFRRPE